MEFSVLLTIVQGLVVGVTLMVPGMSGGTMAMVLGAYENLIKAVSSFFRHPKKSVIFLAAFAVPALAGMVLLAQPLLDLISRFEKPMMYLFMGAVAGSIPLIYKKVQVKRLNWKFFLYLAIGIFIVIAVRRKRADRSGFLCDPDHRGDHCSRSPCAAGDQRVIYACVDGSV